MPFNAAPLSRRRSPGLLGVTAEIGVGAVAIGLVPILVDGRLPWIAVRLLAAAVVGMVLHALIRRPARLAGTALIVAGVIGAAAGGAIAVPYLSASGIGLRSCGGVMAAVGGVALIACGAGMVRERVRGWRRLPAVAVGLLAIYVIGFPIAYATAAVNVPRRAIADQNPGDRGLEFVEATFATSDGVLLSGWYIPSRNRATVIVLHGASSTRSAVLDHAVVLARHGYGVLLFDARGLGRSAGRAMNLGWYGDVDMRAAVDYVRARTDVDPTRIAALGESMGGEEAIGALANDARLRAVVAEGATNRVIGDWSWLPGRYGVRGRFQHLVNRLAFGLTDLMTDAEPPSTLRSAVTAAAPRPILLIAAGNVPDERYADEFIRASSPGTVELWVAEGANHTGALRTDPSEWTRRVTSFLDDALGLANRPR